MDMSPSAKGVIVPVYIPDNNGEPVLHVADADLENDVLTIKFKDTIAALVLEHMISRGQVMGFSVINVQEQIDELAANPPAE